MTLNPIILFFVTCIIAVGVYIRLTRHPVIPVITMCGLISLLILVGSLFVIDSTILPSESTETSSFLINLIVWRYNGTELSKLYDAFSILKGIVVALMLATQFSLLIETGLILRHKKERNR